MEKSDIKIMLVPLEADDHQQFILDNLRAFKYGALEEFGMRDDRMEEGEEVISRKTIERCINGEQAETYRIVCDGNVFRKCFYRALNKHRESPFLGLPQKYNKYA